MHERTRIFHSTLALTGYLLGTALVGTAVLTILWDGPRSAPRTSSSPYLAAALARPATAEPVARAAEPVPQSENAKILLHHGTFTGARGSSPEFEYVVIEASVENVAPIRLTGMRLRSGTTGASVEIPRALYLYKSTDESEQDDVRLSPGEQAIVLTGRSPVGTSFKSNRCSGYLETFQEFTPPLQKLCPLPEEELEYLFLDDSRAVLEGSCLNFVSSLDQCETPGVSADDFSRECEQFTHTVFSYDACVDRHHAEPDFSSHEWRIFLNQESPLWSDEHERIELLNHRGEVVDALSY